MPTNDNYKVYKHTTPSNKIYIGITHQSLNERWRKGKGYRKNQAFFKAIEKYGWDNISHEVLFENLTKKEACEKEIELIDFYKSNNKKFGYNITCGGEINKGFHLSEKTKKLISIRNSGVNNGMYGKRFKQSQKALEKYYESIKTRNYFGKNNPKAKKVYQFDLNHNLIKIWDCIKEASNYLNISYSYLISIMKNKQPYENYVWLYEREVVEHGK